MLVYTKTGTAITLDSSPLGEGGEGKVYVVQGHPHAVAKIYSTADDALAHKEKIEAMSTMTLPPQIRDRVAWPVGALYSDTNASHFVGFGMPRIDERLSLVELYKYPSGQGMNFSVGDKLRVMESLADTVAALHSSGHVVGDFNDGNAGVVRGCEVAMHDVDSFHITDASGRLYRCPVCYPGWAAPEVLRAVRGSTYETCHGETFTDQSDDWALAVHVFKAIFNGVHPYHCAIDSSLAKGSVPASIPIEKRVERGETPFFKAVPGAQSPLFSPGAGMLPPYMKDAFMRAFVDGHADPSARPTAQEWSSLVHRYRSDLTTCSANGAHQYWSGITTGCPYCAAERRLGGALTRVAATGTVRRIAEPQAQPKHASPAGNARTAAKMASGRAPALLLAFLKWGLILGGGALGVYCIVMIVVALLPSLLCAAIFVAFIAGLCDS